MTADVGLQGMRARKNGETVEADGYNTGVRSRGGESGELVARIHPSTEPHFKRCAVRLATPEAALLPAAAD